MTVPSGSRNFASLCDIVRINRPDIEYSPMTAGLRVITHMLFVMGLYVAPDASALMPSKR